MVVNRGRYWAVADGIAASTKLSASGSTPSPDNISSARNAHRQTAERLRQDLPVRLAGHPWPSSSTLVSTGKFVTGSPRPAPRAASGFFLIADTV